MISKNKDILRKVIAWRVISIIITYIVMLIYIGDALAATWFSVFLHLFLTSINYIFEIVWSRFFEKKKLLISQLKISES